MAPRKEIPAQAAMQAKAQPDGQADAHGEQKNHPCQPLPAVEQGHQNVRQPFPGVPGMSGLEEGEGVAMRDFAGGQDPLARQNVPSGIGIGKQAPRGVVDEQAEYDAGQRSRQTEIGNRPGCPGAPLRRTRHRRGGTNQSAALAGHLAVDLVPQKPDTRDAGAQQQRRTRFGRRVGRRRYRGEVQACREGNVQIASRRQSERELALVAAE